MPRCRITQSACYWLLWLALLSHAAAAAQSPLYRVEAIIDGDTIVVEGAGKVRLLGINAPEIAHHDNPAEPLGDEARRRLDGLLHNKRVYLQFDRERRDRFGRLLAHVRLEDGTEVNALLLREGLARALFLQPNLLHLEHYFRQEAEAQHLRLGLWARPEFQLHPAHQAQNCINRFCRLEGEVLGVGRKGRFTYLRLPGNLQVAILNDHLTQFLVAGIDVGQLQGRQVTVRGRVGERDNHPYLRLQHPLQLRLSAGTYRSR